MAKIAVKFERGRDEPEGVSRKLLGYKQRMRKRPFFVQPLGVAAEPTLASHLEGFRDVILVAALGPYGFTSLERYREARPWNRDGLV